VIAGLKLTKRPQALLLDAGDTLLFFDAEAVAYELGVLGVTVEPAALDGALHVAKRAYQARLATGHHHEDGWNVLVGELLVGAGVAPAVAQKHLPALRRIHDDFYFWRKVPDELPAALERARDAGIKLAIVSNSEGRLRSVLERVGLFSHFELVIDSHLEGVQKPDPEIFRRALVRLGVHAERSVYAGDIPEVDVHGAERVGMHGVLIDAGGHYAALTSVARAPSVADLIDALLALPR
jgi:HAD superfamily hydrolase (TIGR01662 family)